MANEKRLIDVVDEAIKRYAEDGDILQFISDVRFAVINASTVSAVEVVHGRWKHQYEKGLSYMVCSICGCRNGLELKFNYCPNCGAKMDGGNEDG